LKRDFFKSLIIFIHPTITDETEDETQRNLDDEEVLNISTKSMTSLKTTNSTPKLNAVNKSPVILSPKSQKKVKSPSTVDDNPLVAQMSQQLSSLIGLELSPKPNSERIKSKSPTRSAHVSSSNCV